MTTYYRQLKDLPWSPAGTIWRDSEDCENFVFANIKDQYGNYIPMEEWCVEFPEWFEEFDSKNESPCELSNCISCTESKTPGEEIYSILNHIEKDLGYKGLSYNDGKIEPTTDCPEESCRCTKNALLVQALIMYLNRKDNS